MQKAGAGEAAHQRDGAEDVHDVIYVEAIARTLVAAHAGQGSIHAISQPVERQADDNQKQRGAVVAGERIEDAGANLRAEAEQRELVRAEPPGRALSHPLQGALLDGGGQSLVDAAARGKYNLILCCRLKIHFHLLFCGVLS